MYIPMARRGDVPGGKEPYIERICATKIGTRASIITHSFHFLFTFLLEAEFSIPDFNPKKS